MDLHTLVVNNGQERSVPQWLGLFKESGFEFVELHPTRSLMQIVEAIAVEEER
jgi:hypothetical protein